MTIKFICLKVVSLLSFVFVLFLPHLHIVNATVARFYFVNYFSLESLYITSYVHKVTVHSCKLHSYCNIKLETVHKRCSYFQTFIETKQKKATITTTTM